MVDCTAKGFVYRAMDRRALQVACELRSGLLDLAIISRTAPMLGYLGTVLAVLTIIYRAVHSPEEWIPSVAVSRGIYFGLVPILLGLSVGTLAQILERYGKRHADTLSAEIIESEPDVAIVPGVFGFVERAMERKAKLVGLELDKRLHHLVLIASVAPLIGVCGTVYSELTDCFPTLGTGRSTAMAYVFNALAHSLLWSLAGLLIGITVSFAHRVLCAQADALKAEIPSTLSFALKSLPRA